MRWSSSFSVRSRSSLRLSAASFLRWISSCEQSSPGALGWYPRLRVLVPGAGAGSKLFLRSLVGAGARAGAGARGCALRLALSLCSAPPCHRLAALVSWRPSRRVDCGGLRAAAAASSSFRLDASWNIPETRLLSLFQYGSKCAMAVVDASSDVPTEATGFANETRARFGTPGASRRVSAVATGRLGSGTRDARPFGARSRRCACSPARRPRVA